MSRKHICDLKRMLAACFLYFLFKDETRQTTEIKLCFPLQDSTLNEPQQTLNCIHSYLSPMNSSLAKTINITLLLQCIH